MSYRSSLPGLHILNPLLSPHEHQLKLILKLFYHVPFSKKTDIFNKLLPSPIHVMEYVTRLYLNYKSNLHLESKPLRYFF